MQKIAYFDSSHDMPEEIINAAGFYPYKILGNINESSDLADQYLPNFFCPAARSWLTEALKYSHEWAGIIVAHGCDATNRQFDIWKRHVKTPFLYWFNNPMNRTISAAKFFKKELRRLIFTLENQYNVKITKENISNAIKNSNEIKIRLQKLSNMRAIKDISNEMYYKVLVKCLQSHDDHLIADLDEIIHEWSSRLDFPLNMKKILLTGSDVTNVEWMNLLEKSKFRVVRDDLSIGERYFATLIPTRDDPLDAIVEYYFSIPQPATKNPPDNRLRYLKKSLQQTPLDGVISQNLKFCEPYAYDSVFISNSLKEEKIPLIHLEREFSSTFDHQILNRLEAFWELI